MTRFLVALAIIAGSAAPLVQADDSRESWVLILSPRDQPMFYVPGFTSERTYELAIAKWQNSEKNVFQKAVCAKQ